MNQDTDESKTRKLNSMLWIKRLGFAGFLFFLVKGLVWLAVIFGVAKCWS